jgi:S-formylglutathione hydrolase FrmB
MHTQRLDRYRARMRLRLSILAALAAGIVAVAVAHARPSSIEPPLVDTSFFSRAIDGRLHVAVYLPTDYGRDGRRYPVVYFLHGLPAAATAYRGAGFVAQAVAGRAIVVAPQGARPGDTDPEYHDWGPGRNWETALATELPAWVDSHFRTIPDRRGRAIVGISAGGYGAFLIGLHHLDEFGAIESWSGYFHPTDPSGTVTLDVGSDADDRRASAHALLPSVAAAMRADPTFVAFYVGAGDIRFAKENQVLNRELAQARVRHLFRLYPGKHEQALWQAHARGWIDLALRGLERPR